MEAKSKVIRFSFIPAGAKLYQSWYKDLLFSVLTCGVYSFWWIANAQKNRFQQIKVLNQNIDYTATGMTLFDQFLHLFRYYGTAFLLVDALRTSVGSNQNLFIVVECFIGLMGFTVYRYDRKLQLFRNLQWSDQGIQVESKKLNYLRAYMNWGLVTLLSLGVLAPLRRFKLFKLESEGMSIKEHAVVYAGDLKEFSLLYWRGVVLSILSLGLYLPWWRASIHNYELEHLRWKNMQIRSLVSGGDLFFLYLENGLIGLLTLGLGWPLMQNNGLKLRSQKIALIENELDVDRRMNSSVHPQEDVKFHPPVSTTSIL